MVHSSLGKNNEQMPMSHSSLGKTCEFVCILQFPVLLSWQASNFLSMFPMLWCHLQRYIVRSTYDSVLSVHQYIFSRCDISKDLGMEGVVINIFFLVMLIELHFLMLKSTSHFCSHTSRCCGSSIMRSQSVPLAIFLYRIQLPINNLTLPWL